MMNDQDTIRHIVDWITQYVSNMPKPAESLIVVYPEVSDSSLTSSLASMTGIKTFAVPMPIMYKHCIVNTDLETRAR